MGKVRKVALGDEKQEKAQKKKADARREGKKAKKASATVVEGTELKAEVKELLEKVESGAKAGTSAKKSKSKGPKVRGKKYQEAVKLIDKAKLYPLADAVKLVKQTSITKFDATVELHIALNPATLGDKTDY
ncbi:MAG: hypothetical protein ACD_77C00113G0001, partial [uncultured bacterium]